MSTDKHRVQFRAPSRLVERTDALAVVLGEDRTDILVTTLREYFQAAAHDDTLTQEIAAAYYDDEISSDQLIALLGVEQAANLCILKQQLDDGENATVTLANDLGAELFLCDEFTRLGLIHVSLADTRLVTTPTLLSVFVRTDCMTGDEARTLLDTISDAQSWDANSYVQRARTLLDDS